MKLTGTLLFVDDDRTILENCSTWFEVDGYRVFTAVTGHSALEVVKENTIDVLIADYLMPVMDGIELISQAMKIQPDLQTIVFTGHADLESAKKAIELGVRAYVEKDHTLNSGRGGRVVFLTKDQQTDLHCLQTHVDRLVACSARYLIVSAMNTVLWAWEKTVRKAAGHYGKTGYKADFAEASGLWSVQNDKGVLRTRGLDRYLDVAKLPPRPNKELVTRSIRFVMDRCRDSDPASVADLNKKMIQLERIMMG